MLRRGDASGHGLSVRLRMRENAETNAGVREPFRTAWVSGSKRKLAVEAGALVQPLNSSGHASAGRRKHDIGRTRSNKHEYPVTTARSLRFASVTFSSRSFSSSEAVFRFRNSRVSDFESSLYSLPQFGLYVINSTCYVLFEMSRCRRSAVGGSGVDAVTPSRRVVAISF